MKTLWLLAFLMPQTPVTLPLDAYVCVDANMHVITHCPPPCQYMGEDEDELQIWMCGEEQIAR